MPDELDTMEARLSRQMELGFNSVHARMTRFEEEVRPLMREQGEQIAVLTDRSQRAAVTAKRTTATRASVWGGAVGTAVLIAVEVIKAYFSTGGSK